jgi:hypothetical protein
MSEFQGLPTHSGLLDFGQEIDERLEQIVPAHDARLSDEYARGLPRTPHIVTTRADRPDKMHARTYVLGAAVVEVTAPTRQNLRESVTVTCQSGGPIAVGTDDQTATGHLTVGGPSVAIPNGAARSFLNKGPVWVAGPAGAVVDVVIEYYTAAP